MKYNQLDEKIGSVCVLNHSVEHTVFTCLTLFAINKEKAKVKQVKYTITTMTIVENQFIDKSINWSISWNCKAKNNFSWSLGQTKSPLFDHLYNQPYLGCRMNGQFLEGTRRRESTDQADDVSSSENIQTETNNHYHCISRVINLLINQSADQSLSSYVTT